jgi:alpha-D-xyloside xylohydrolase
MSWNEAEKSFAIGDRKGEFPGMLKDRTFRIVWVSEKNGVGIEPAGQAATIQYKGKEIKIKK